MSGQAAASTAAKEFTITRVFDASRDLIWRAWSEPERLAQWWGPKGCKIEIGKLEFCPGGIFHYSMRMPDGQTVWWGRFVYREIEKPRRIVFVNSFSDEKGGLARAPFSPAWPLEVLNDLTLTEQDGKTTLALRSGPINPNAEERVMFEGMFDSMRQGFGGTFDQLDDYLKGA
ncbi:MAG: SRPBCC domain-containing protein [Afipia sp.]|nr:SRPBCC domain-containing protein [Afipia sp.]